MFSEVLLTDLIFRGEATMWDHLCLANWIQGLMTHQRIFMEHLSYSREAAQALVVAAHNGNLAEALKQSRKPEARACDFRGLGQAIPRGCGTALHQVGDSAAFRAATGSLAFNQVVVFILWCAQSCQ
ncbi:unnamed protein product [Symbiodinium natans]|uniref:Uncharacterized protein n=1 Tax=Symbiodinium natans TaxID=878477 RepID=A0A812LF87_9DINO|nr:unnamed protein product [Symbiodinium natans]